MIITPGQDFLKFIQSRSPPVPTNLKGLALNHDNSQRLLQIVADKTSRL